MPTDPMNPTSDPASQQPVTSIVPPAPAERKLSHPDSPVTQLKLLWRNEMSDDDHDYWRDLFASPTPNYDIRREILAKYQIELRYDTQLIRFRRWADAYEERTEQIQAEADAVAQATAALQKEGLTPEQLRSALLNRMSTRALATGDYKLAAQALKLDAQIERSRLALRRLDLQTRRALALETEAEKYANMPYEEAVAKIREELERPGGW